MVRKKSRRDLRPSTAPNALGGAFPQVVCHQRRRELYVQRWLSAPLKAPWSREIWEPAGLGDLTVVGGPVHALRVRCVDGSGVPGSGSSGTAMTWWSTAEPRSRRNGFASRSRPGWPECGGCRLHPDRTGSCTARTASGGARTSTPGSPSLATRFGRAGSGPEPGSSLRVQSGRVRRGRQTHAVRSDPGGCTCAAARASATSHERSTRSCGDGSATTGGSTSLSWSTSSRGSTDT
jgi:hypothetical protein